MLLILLNAFVLYFMGMHLLEDSEVRNSIMGAFILSSRPIFIDNIVFIQ